MNDLTDPKSLLPEFRAACDALEIKPRAALKQAGLDPSLWLKWERGDASPTLKSLASAHEGLRSLAATRQAA